MRYLTITETNELIKRITEDNQTYGTIVKLMYIYGKEFKQIIQLKKEDITETSIQFKGQKFPLKKEDYNTLKNYAKSSNTEYIFLTNQFEDLGEETNKYRKKLIYYFTQNLKQLHLPTKIKYSGLSLTDLRRLRGQHLILKGVDLKLVMDLYQQKPNARTQFKKYLKYDELYKLSSEKQCNSMEDIFHYCTDTDIFQLEDFKNNNQYIVTNMKESTLILLDYDNLTFIEEISDEFKDNVINIYQNTDLIGDIKGLQPSQYKLLDDMKFIKV